MPTSKTSENIPKDVLKTAKNTLADLDDGIKAVKEKIQEEKKLSKISTADLEKSVQATQLQLQTLQEDIDSNKAQVKSRQAEISNWNKWYETTPIGEKASAFLKFSAETGWRLTEIGNIEKKISTLVSAHLAVFRSLEKAKEHLAAVNAGVHSLPIDQDPRLKYLFDAKAMVQASLSSAPKSTSKKK